MILVYLSVKAHRPAPQQRKLLPTQGNPLRRHDSLRRVSEQVDLGSIHRRQKSTTPAALCPVQLTTASTAKLSISWE